MPTPSWRRLGGHLPVRCGGGVPAPPRPCPAPAPQGLLGTGGFRHICHSDTHEAIVFNTVAALRMLRMLSGRGGRVAVSDEECIYTVLLLYFGEHVQRYLLGYAAVTSHVDARLALAFLS